MRKELVARLHKRVPLPTGADAFTTAVVVEVVAMVELGI